MPECDHTVGWENNEYDGGSWPVFASDADTQFFDVDTRFSFCPDCGASLKEFWEKRDG